MEQAALSPLAAWGSFSVIIGSSAAVLIGLQFVVITLGAGMNTQAGESGMNAFASPTVVHFSTVLFISAVVSAPWPALSGARLALSAESRYQRTNPQSAEWRMGTQDS